MTNFDSVGMQAGADLAQVLQEDDSLNVDVKFPQMAGGGEVATVITGPGRASIYLTRACAIRVSSKRGEPTVTRCSRRCRGSKRR